MTSRHRYLEVRELEPGDAGEIAKLLLDQPPAYIRFFYAFGSSEAEIEKLLRDRNKDVYAGIYWRGALEGVFMLRGWDAGYDVPSFGVLIGDRHRGGALMRIALDMAKVIARMSGARQLMAKIHPDNVSPRGARRLGLIQSSVEPQTGNVVYHMEL